MDVMIIGVIITPKRLSGGCAALELEMGNPSQAIKSHVDPEDVQKLDTLTAGGRQRQNAMRARWGGHRGRKSAARRLSFLSVGDFGSSPGRKSKRSECMPRNALFHRDPPARRVRKSRTFVTRLSSLDFRSYSPSSIARMGMAP